MAVEFGHELAQTMERLQLGEQRAALFERPSGYFRELIRRDSPVEFLERARELVRGMRRRERGGAVRVESPRAGDELGPSRYSRAHRRDELRVKRRAALGQRIERMRQALGVQPGEAMRNSAQ